MRKHFIAMNRELYEKRTPPVSVYLKLMEPPFRHLYSVDSEIQKMVISKDITKEMLPKKA